jgi:flagellar biosynthesis chaperone FliJ
MKMFSWPLQRLLDLAVQKEQILQGQVLKLAQEIRSLQREVRQIRSQIADRLRDLGLQSLAERLARREVFLRWSISREGEIADKGAQAAALREKRTSLLQEFHRARSARKTLERLREESLLRYKKQSLRTEQVRLDEAAQGAHARRGIEGSQVSERSMGILPMSSSSVPSLAQNNNNNNNSNSKDMGKMPMLHTGRMPVPQVTQ